MLNSIIIMGRLTRDPDLRMTQNQKSVVNMTLAVDRDYAAAGERKETDFIDVVAFGATADHIHKYFVKGQMAIVTGRLQMRDWTDRDGNKRTSAEVVADRVMFGESKRSREENAGAPRGGSDNYSNRGGYQSFDNASGASAFSALDEADG